jgi:peptidoglycan/LPS O-acetylase OafA/YrhL
MHVTKEQTLIIKGIAIIMVLIGHLVPQFFPYANIYVPVKRMISQIGVEFFMIISGYGVLVAYITPQKKPSLFFARRFTQLWPIYAFAMLAYFLMSRSFFGEGVTLQSLVLHLLWLQVFFNVQNDIYSAAHFFSALLIVYFVAYIVLAIKMRGKNALVFSFCFIAAQLLHRAFSGSYIFTDYIASFSFGLFLASFVLERKNIFNFLYLAPFLFCLDDPYSLFKAFVGSMGFLVVLHIFKAPSPVSNMEGILSFLGLHSYVIYLSHNYFVWKWPQIVSVVGGKAETGGIIIVATCIWTACLFIVNRFYSKQLLPVLLSWPVQTSIPRKIDL